MLDWLTENKIPVGRVAREIFDWLRDNGEPVIDVFADAMEALIDAILQVLQEPPNTGWFRDLPRDEITYLYPEALHPLVIIAIFVGITWALQRSWQTCLFVALGFLFILNQGYWEETTESLTLVLSACLVCMAVGVPIGIFAAHRPRFYAALRPVLDLMQTLPTFVYLIPAIVFFGIGMVPGLIATVIFVLPAPIRLTYLEGLGHARAASGGRASLWRHQKPGAVEGRAALCLAADHGGAEPDDHAVAVDGGDRGACGCRWAWRAGGARAQPGEHRARVRERAFVIVVVAIILDRMLNMGGRNT